MNAEEHNTKENINRLFSNPDYVVSYVDKSRLKFYQNVANSIIEKGMSHEGKRIADMGCATGHLLNHIDKKYEVDSLVGVDFASETLKIAKSLSWKHDVQFYEHDLHDPMDEFSEAFDIVFCTQTLEHTRNPTRFMENILPILAPEGVLMITIPDGATDGFVGILHICSWTIDQFHRFIAEVSTRVLKDTCFEVDVMSTRLRALVWNKANA